MISIVSCVAIFFVFVLGCVDFALGSVDYINMHLSSCGFNYSAYVGVTYQYDTNDYYTEVYYASDYDGRICSYVVSHEDNTWGMGILCSTSFSFRGTHGSNEYIGTYTGNINPTDFGYEYCTSSSSYGNSIVDKSSNIIMFSSYDDAKNYILTGEVNNPLYKPKEDIEFDSDIEIPLNLDIRLNGSSDFVPNIKISCNQTEQVENRYLEVQYSIGYKATWSLLGGVGLNIKSKTSPTVYGSIEQLEESFDNSGTSFETIFPMTKISHSVAPDKEKFSQYEPTPKVYWSLKEIKNHNSEMKIWCRNRVGNKASKWVMVSGDSHKANFDVVGSDENGNPTDLKDDTANSNTGYGSDYWNNRDNTPQDEYSNVDVKTNLKDLKSNYSSLANFYKELFVFLPAEIWILLIGLVSTMVIIAIIRFVRG